MKQSPDKTDYTDARMLADLQRVGYLPRVWLAPHWIRDLRTLVGYRHSLVRQRTAAKLRIRALLREHRIQNSQDTPWSRPWMDWLRHRAPLDGHARWILDALLDELHQLALRIRQAEKRMQEATDEDLVVARLMGFKGIGNVTACILRAAIGRFDRFRSGKQLARFCGLSPRNASSGQRQADAGLIHTCDRYLRATLIEATHRLIRFDPFCARLSARLRAKGKHACVATAAVANRWIRRLFHQMKPLGLAQSSTH
jgi:transposase